MKKLYLMPLSILLIIGFILVGCSGASSTTTSAPPPPATTAAPAPATTTSAAATSAAPTSAAPTSATPTQTSTNKELDIGWVGDLSNETGIGAMHVFETYAAMDNAAGGIQIGPDRYNVKIIEYSDESTTGSSLNADVSAINRLVEQDHVKFIHDGGFNVDAIVPITEHNKVISFFRSEVYNSGLKPQWHYNYDSGELTAQHFAVAGWMLKNFPKMIEPGQLVFAFPDNSDGHTFNEIACAPYLALGAKPTTIYFPAGQGDLSSLGTKVVSMKPAFFQGMSSFAVSEMANIDKAVYDAGYRGQFFSFISTAEQQLAAVFPKEVLEGFISGAMSTEFDPPLTSLAQTFKSFYTTKNSKWDYPDYVGSEPYYALREALIEAGTTDVDAVNAVLSKGVSFNSIDGPGKTFDRPDMGNSRAVEFVNANPIKKSQNGQPVLLANVGPDEGIAYFRQAYPATPSPSSTQ